MKNAGEKTVLHQLASYTTYGSFSSRMSDTSIPIHRRALLRRGKGPSGHSVCVDRTPLSFSYILAVPLGVVVQYSAHTTEMRILGAYLPSCQVVGCSFITWMNPNTEIGIFGRQERPCRLRWAVCRQSLAVGNRRVASWVTALLLREERGELVHPQVDNQANEHGGSSLWIWGEVAGVLALSVMLNCALV